MKCDVCDKETNEYCACGVPIHRFTKCHQKHSKEEIEDWKDV